MRKKRTVKVNRVSLIIAVKGAEPLLSATIRNARRSAGTDISVICCFDGEASAPAKNAGEDIRIIERERTGCGPMRHAGIMAAASPIIVACDAHMDFSKGWAVALEDLFAASSAGKTVACAPMRACDSSFRRHDGKTRALYTGCRMAWTDLGKNENLTLAAKWHDHTPGSQIGCVMGAFYAFRREWYLKIGCPWSALSGYGLDEEMISIASWLAGGDVRLLKDIEVAHVFNEVSPCIKTALDFARIWINRLRLIYLVPVPAPERFQLLAALTGSASFGHYRDVLDAVQPDLARPEVAALRARWSTPEARRCWEAFVARFVDGYVPAKIEPAALPVKKQVIIVKPEVCSRCNAVNSFRVPRGGKTLPASADSNKKQIVACARCGAPAVRIFDGTIRQERADLLTAMKAV